jgi:hypothetical protein
VPDIAHATVLRWRSEPEDRAAARAAFEAAAAAWAPVAIPLDSVAAVVETRPYMHGAESFWFADDFPGTARPGDSSPEEENRA